MSLEYGNFSAEVKVADAVTSARADQKSGNKSASEVEATPLQSALQEATAKQELTPEELTRATETLTEVAQNLNQDIRFAINSDEFERPIIRVIDRESGDIIRQIPTEDFLRLASRMQELNNDQAIDSATGLLIDSQV